MCGRYVLYTDKEAREINEIVQEVERKLSPETKLNTGEIVPTHLAPILIAQEQKIEPVAMQWGYPGFQNKGIIINARAETALEKPTFRQSVLTKRCVIPSTGFFEWTHPTDKKLKEKYLFNLPGTQSLYMAGLYRTFEKDGKASSQFVILTTQANDSMVTVHERMPIVLTPENMEIWLKEAQNAQHILRLTPPELIKTKQ